MWSCPGKKNLMCYSLWPSLWLRSQTHTLCAFVYSGSMHMNRVLTFRTYRSISCWIDTEALCHICNMWYILFWFYFKIIFYLCTISMSCKLSITPWFRERKISLQLIYNININRKKGSVEGKHLDVIALDQVCMPQSSDLHFSCSFFQSSAVMSSRSSLGKGKNIWTMHEGTSKSSPLLLSSPRWESTVLSAQIRPPLPSALALAGMELI